MKKIVNFTPTGTQPTRENSHAPLTPSEIVEEVHQAYEMGITVTHIHARDPKDLKNTYRKDVYALIIEGIRKHCKDLSICVSLTGRLFPEFEKRSEVLELLPDMGSLTMSSLNFPGGESVNSPEMILRLIEKMDEYGVIPEIEVFDSGMMNYASYLIGKGVIKPPYYINAILGNIYNAQADIYSIGSILNSKPANSMMCVGGIGKEQLRSNMMGLMYFDGIRIGLEDNLYWSGKSKATNLELLTRIFKIMGEIGHEPISPKEFKEMGYANKISNIRI